MLFGAESVVKKMITARSKTTANTGLTKQLEAVGNPLVAVVADAEPIAKSLRSVLKDVPPPMALFTPYIAGAQTVNLTWDLDAAAMLNVSLKLKTPELAQGLFGMLDQQFQAIKQQYDATKPGLKQNPGLSGVVPYADQVLTETKLTNAGETIALTIPRIQNIEKLIDLLRPGFEGANRAAAQIMRKNEMKKIGLAFHNFESSFTHFPAHNGLGEESKPNRGLSWRVYLLPYLGEYGLYNKFHLDEPWDSPANRELIKLMPETYGKNAEGKTSIHVLSGAGTPFASDKPTKISDFTDGLSNCILAVEAGADTAEIWTKPGGRAFDPADPLKSLGNVTEFYALMGDGAVRLMKNVDKETFRKLVQHADGETINEIP
jgi:hypothetical protein